ncbi:hypothetical protein Dimus_022968 [Dionaea muscipula]
MHGWPLPTLVGRCLRQLATRLLRLKPVVAPGHPREGVHHGLLAALGGSLLWLSRVRVCLGVVGGGLGGWCLCFGGLGGGLCFCGCGARVEVRFTMSMHKSKKGDGGQEGVGLGSLGAVGSGGAPGMKVV